MISVHRANDDVSESAQLWRRVKLSALGLGALTTAGIVGLMFLAAGKDEDIAGIVAPALLLLVICGVVAAVAAFRQKRAR